ncbi:hypothetical protein MTBSS4_50160 [Magnetospirillum sp. SS-4]|nr:hypothetical protein MTBSS4_50160 [Magnetospirillum sp. SS-4]
MGVPDAQGRESWDEPARGAREKGPDECSSGQERMPWHGTPVVGRQYPGVPARFRGTMVIVTTGETVDSCQLLF